MHHSGSIRLVEVLKHVTHQNKTIVRELFE